MGLFMKGVRMLIATKMNRILRIEEDKKDEYAKMGYKVETESGDVIAEPEATTLAGAMEIIKHLRAENDDLKASINSLKADLSKKKAVKKETVD